MNSFNRCRCVGCLQPKANEFMCVAHWARVPKKMKKAIADKAEAAGSRWAMSTQIQAYTSAVQDAIDHVVALEGIKLQPQLL